MKATLYGSRLSPFVEKVARALQLKRIDFSVVDPRGPNDLKKWNPTTGKMPVLDIGGEKPFDSTLILRRLDELVADPPLVSRDPEIAAKQHFLEDWSDESLYWYVMALRWNPANSKATIAQIAEFMPAPLRPVIGVVLNWQIGGQARAQGLARLPLGTVLDDQPPTRAEPPRRAGGCASRRSAARPRRDRRRRGAARAPRAARAAP